ncbi:MAG TPA: pilus assembly protein N-terminal domain-containing protein [Phenylobacterium sp.]|nr:pilus assembly protein N-terminal domain-containing protein [Phenylobacterium sp.]
MRPLITSLAALIAVVGSAAPSLAAESFAVPIDQSASIALPRGAQNVMVGNPAIADVNILDARTAVLLGRTYGVTNLLVTDAKGRTIMDRQIVVSSGDAGRITVVRGAATGPHAENYACAPRCERAPMPGETDVDYNRYSSAYSGYSGRAAEGRNSGAAKPGP